MKTEHGRIRYQTNTRLARCAAWLLDSELKGRDSVAQECRDERDHAREGMRKAQRELQASKEWLQLTALVRSQMLNKPFLAALGWHLDKWPAGIAVPDDVREQLVLEAKAMLVSHMLTEILSGANTQVRAVVTGVDEHRFMRFDVVLIKPIDCHVAFPVEIVEEKLQ